MHGGMHNSMHDDRQMLDRRRSTERCGETRKRRPKRHPGRRALHTQRSEDLRMPYIHHTHAISGATEINTVSRRSPPGVHSEDLLRNSMSHPAHICAFAKCVALHNWQGMCQESEAMSVYKASAIPLPVTFWMHVARGLLYERSSDAEWSSGMLRRIEGYLVGHA